jgi:UDP-N-acetyl-D-mannosaminuronate dehydrogenase
MKEDNKIVIVGLGEVGRPLLNLLSDNYNVIGVDIAPPREPIGAVDVLHICYPFEIKDFVGETARYIDMFKPKVTVINSTVGVGTTRRVAERSGTPVVHSPVLGKHARMLEEMRSYTKFLGGVEAASTQFAAEHFQGAGLKTKTLSAPEATELAKLTETTYFGVMIAYAQEVERYCDKAGQSYEEVVSFYGEVPFFPKTKYFPGVIGGHCVLPNIEILRKLDDSNLLAAVKLSNKAKLDREAARKAAAEQNLKPVETRG